MNKYILIYESVPVESQCSFHVSRCLDETHLFLPLNLDPQGKNEDMIMQLESLETKKIKK